MMKVSNLRIDLLLGAIATIILPPHVTSADCLVGDIMYQEGQSGGHIGYECINGTDYTGIGSTCGPNGEMEEAEMTYTCPDSVPYCVQCGPPGRGAALCLSTPTTDRDCDDDDDGDDAVLPPALVANMDGAYPGYEGDIRPIGSVTVTFPESENNGAKLTAEDWGSIEFSYDLEGLEPNCTECGIHIHVGTTCDVADEVGGHYYCFACLSTGDDDTEVDPWVPPVAVYNSDMNGNAKGSFTLTSGYDEYAENLGRAVVIHARDGKIRVSCGILEEEQSGEPKPGDDSATDSSSDPETKDSSASKRDFLFLHVGVMIAAAVTLIVAA